MPRVHADDAVVEARQPALVLGHQLRLKRGLPVAWNIQVKFAIGRDDRLRATAVAVIACLALLGFGIEVVGQFGCQHAFCQLLLELPRQARLAENRLGILVLDLGQQLIDQFIRKKRRRLWFLGFLRRAHCYGHGVSLSVSSHDLLHTRNLTGSLAHDALAELHFVAFACLMLSSAATTLTQGS
jgi:hypothetical protein